MPMYPQRPTPRSRRVPLVIAVVFLIVAVLGVAGALTWALAAKPSTSTPSSFRNADELVDYLGTHGLQCGPIEHVAGPATAESLIDCGKTIVIAVYATHDDAVGQFEEQSATLAGIAKVHMAIGSNWTVSSDDPAYAKAAAGLLRAEYRTT